MIAAKALERSENTSVMYLKREEAVGVTDAL